LAIRPINCGIPAVEPQNTLAGQIPHFPNCLSKLENRQAKRKASGNVIIFKMLKANLGIEAI
jgi:hypothetical protein